MGYATESDARGRLQSVYAAMSDRELCDLAAEADNLTDMAREVLRAELGARRLTVPAAAQTTSPMSANLRAAMPSRPGAGVSATIVGYGLDLEQPEAESSTAGPGEVSLRTFHDAFEMGRACESLEESEVPFRVEDVSEESAQARGGGYAPAAMNLIVARHDRERAMAVLREKMGLFPLQEVTQPDAGVDDGSVSPVGSFAQRTDAEGVENALEQAGIWHRLVANPEGSVAAEDAWVVEVREVDLIRAGDVLEKALGLAEE